MTSVLPATLLDRARAAARPQVTGVVTGAMGLTLTVDGIAAAVGDLVEIDPADLPSAPDGTAAADDFVPGALQVAAPSA